MRFFIIFMVLFLLVLPVFTSHAGVLTGSLTNVQTAGAYQGAETSVQVLVGRIINAFLSLLGTIFLGYLLYGGYRWFTAAGNEEEVKKAKDIIRQAIIGLAIIMAAGAISFFVTVSLEGATGTGAATQ